MNSLAERRRAYVRARAQTEEGKSFQMKIDVCCAYHHCEHTEDYEKMLDKISHYSRQRREAFRKTYIKQYEHFLYDGAPTK